MTEILKHDGERPYPGSLATARMEAIEGIASNVFENIKPDAEGEDFEVNIGPDEVVDMVSVVVSSLEAQGALKPRVAIVAADVPQIVDNIIDVFSKRNLVEDNEAEQTGDMEEE